MHDDVLAVAAGERADGRHAAAAVARAVAGRGAIDVAGVEAAGTVVTVPAAGGQGTDESCGSGGSETHRCG